MTRYLLDSDTLEFLGDGNSPYHRSCIANLEALEEDDEICISLLTLYEMDNALAGASVEVAQRLELARAHTLSHFTVLPLTVSGSRIFGRLKRLFKDVSGTKPRAMKMYTVDLMIASTALDHGAVIVSNDGVYDRLGAIMPEFRPVNWAKG
jgi:predicted nucleic acid-binding protein